MIHVSISIEYRGIPFEINIDNYLNTPGMFDVQDMLKLLDRIKLFIDKLLEAKQ